MDRQHASEPGKTASRRLAIDDRETIREIFFVYDAIVTAVQDEQGIGLFLPGVQSLGRFFECNIQPEGPLIEAPDMD